MVLDEDDLKLVANAICIITSVTQKMVLKILCFRKLSDSSEMQSYASLGFKALNDGYAKDTIKKVVKLKGLTMQDRKLYVIVNTVK